MSWLLVVIGGMVGACLRYLIDHAIHARRDTVLPWGTFAANVTGCLILGLASGAGLAEAAPEPVRLLIGTGLCGALSTFSTLSYQTLRLAETGHRLYAAANIVASVAAGIGALLVGLALATAIWV